MILNRRVAIVGSREYSKPAQLNEIVDSHIKKDDIIVSGGAVSEHKCPYCKQPVPYKSADHLAAIYAKKKGYDLMVYHPKYQEFGKPATFIRNKVIVENSDIVLAFYRKGHFQEGGTANTAKWARELQRPLFEYEED